MGFGTSGFSNPITGENGTLIRNWIQSANFITGVSGWRISKDGNAEFNQVTIRGGVIVTMGETILIYSSSTPALGTLIISIAPAAGTDTVGNNYAEGFTIYGASGRQINMGIPGTTPILFFNSAANGEHLGAKLQTNLNGGAGNAQYGQLVIAGDVNTTNQDSVNVLFGGSSTDGTRAATLDFTYVDVLGGLHNYASMDFSGFSIFAGDIDGVHPGTGTGTGNRAVAESWQTPSLGTGWANGSIAGSRQVARYRLLPTKEVEVIGTLHSTSATPSSTMWVMPTGYIPSVQQRLNCQVNKGGGVIATDIIDIDTSGNVILDINATAIGNDVMIGFCYPLN